VCSGEGRIDWEWGGTSNTRRKQRRGGRWSYTKMNHVFPGWWSWAVADGMVGTSMGIGDWGGMGVSLGWVLGLGYYFLEEVRGRKKSSGPPPY
jgi:hypothetical protein